MLVSKRTNCFACENGQLIREYVAPDADTMYARDFCIYCPAIKTTALKIGGQLQQKRIGLGNVHYNCNYDKKEYSWEL